MKVLLDTNVVLDVLLQRGPWLADAEAIRLAGNQGLLECAVTASSLTDIYYIARRLAGKPAARRMVRECLDSLTIVAVDREALELADTLDVDDFEDALQVAAAARHGWDAIITRNASDFAGSPIPVLSPAELVVRLATDTR